jgi:caa(3)-type oxidase subunit IV
MSHNPHAAVHEQESIHHEATPNARSFVTFAILAGLSLLALFVGFSDLGAMKVVASLTVSVVQAGILAYFFMDLRAADKLTWLVAAASLFWTFLMFLFILTDFLTRQFGVL